MRGWQSIQKTRLFHMVVTCLFLVLLVLWNPYNLLYPVRVFVGFVGSPFEKVFSVVGFYVDSSTEFLASIGNLKKDNELLVSDNRRLIAENARLADMQKENETLRKELDLLPRGTFTLKAAEVVGIDQQNSGNWIMINKGTSDGIQKGMVVIVDQSAVVGRVSETSPGTAKVILLTSPESTVNGVDTQTEARGIVRGQYGLGITLDTVLRTDTLKSGDDIVTSGLGGDFPRGLLLGKVDATYASDDKLFQQVTLVPVVNFSKLRTVFVITNGF
jgi:rod shape-determining protein MreC